MNDLVKADSAPTMSSREIAELTGKRHDNVKADIRSMLSDLGKDALNFQAIYLDSMNREQIEFMLDRLHVECLLTGYSAPLRMMVLTRLKEMEAASQAVAPAELSRMEILRIAMEAEEGRLQAIAQRDEAIRTKSQISDRKTATAMATASARSREVARLKHELGRNQVHATVKAVKNATGKEYDWRALKNYCKEHGLEARKVADEQYGSVKAWPAMAWRDVHGVDLENAFPGAS